MYRRKRVVMRDTPPPLCTRTVPAPNMTPQFCKFIDESGRKCPNYGYWCSRWDRLVDGQSTHFHLSIIHALLSQHFHLDRFLMIYIFLFILCIRLVLVNCVFHPLLICSDFVKMPYSETRVHVSKFDEWLKLISYYELSTPFKYKMILICEIILNLNAYRAVCTECPFSLAALSHASLSR